MSEKRKVKAGDEKNWVKAAIGTVIAGIAVGTIIFAVAKKWVPDGVDEKSEYEYKQILMEAEDIGGEREEGEKAGLENTLAELRPALAVLCDEGGNTMGSGFILELQENGIYICTNRHVIEDYDNWEVKFFDGTRVSAIKAGTSQIYDVGIVRVEISDVPEQLLKQLFAVKIDLDYWKELDGRQLEVGFISMYQEAPADKIVTGLLLSTLTEFPWENELRHSEFQLRFVDGDSGSAIFDETGHLISMICGTSYGDGTGRPRRWGIPLSGIMTCYMEIANMDHK